MESSLFAKRSNTLSTLTYAKSENYLFSVVQQCLFRKDIPIELRILVVKYMYYPFIKKKEHLVKLIEYFHSHLSPETRSDDNIKYFLFYGMLEYLDTARITDMSYLFEWKKFVWDLSRWNTRNVTNMQFMFSNCFRWNPNFHIENWNVSKVTDMSYMFYDCQGFNRPINSWNVSSLENASYMFVNCHQFNQSLVNWNVSRLRLANWMFHATRGMKWDWDIGRWNTESLEEMNAMFACCTMFNCPIGSWNVRKVRNAVGFLENAVYFNQPLDNWVFAPEFMDSMFRNCSHFNQRIDHFDCSNLVSMQSLLEGASNFNQPFDNWNEFDALVSMNKMFYRCSSLNQSFHHWNSIVTKSTLFSPSFEDMFSGCGKMNPQSILSWKVFQNMKEDEKEKFILFLGLYIQ